MNSFGRVFRTQIFGESHGPCVGVTIDGCPPGLALTEEDFLKDLVRRQGGRGHNATERNRLAHLSVRIFQWSYHRRTAHDHVSKQQYTAGRL